jgi:hypothetical protein
MIHTDEDDEFERIKRENAMREVQRLGQEIEGQPYHWEIDAIQAAIRIEREACAELCEEMALLTNDIRKASLLVAALNIRARGEQ